jgi:dipeptidase
MGCTTILAGKNITYNGSTFIARNEDSPAGQYSPKKFIVVKPEDQPRHYKAVLSDLELDLPDDPMRYTAMPNAIDKDGVWAAAGVNEANVSMTATETLTSNDRVRAADPLLVKQGIGEEDMVVLVLPYIKSAREGVVRLGGLLEKYGTYEMNGIAFQDELEVWWLETIGGHHWIARRVPDNCYVCMPNQFGIDWFDLDDAYGEQAEFMCSKGLRDFIAKNHLDLSLDGEFNARDAFGSHSDSDKIYNTPRSWFVQRFFNPYDVIWDGDDADYRPDSMDLPWCVEPEKKLTVEDVKYVLSSHYQGTPYDPYGKCPDPSKKAALRPIGVNRNNFLSLTEIRPGMPKEIQCVEWVALASNVFNAFVPFYTNVDSTPEYLSSTSDRVTSENFYWANRIIGALADSQYSLCIVHIERYQNAVQSKGRAIIQKYDEAYRKARKKPDAVKHCEKANAEIAEMLKKETDSVLRKVLDTASDKMKNAFSRSDG